MTTTDTQRADAHTAAIQAAAQAAMRAEGGEFVFLTRDEVSAFVNALPPDVRVRWQVESTVAFGHRYRVTFWRSFWRNSGRKTAETSEETQP